MKNNKFISIIGILILLLGIEYTIESFIETGIFETKKNSLHLSTLEFHTDENFVQKSDTVGFNQMLSQFDFPTTQVAFPQLVALDIKPKAKRINKKPTRKSLKESYKFKKKQLKTKWKRSKKDLKRKEKKTKQSKIWYVGMDRFWCSTANCRSRTTSLRFIKFGCTRIGYYWSE